MQTSGFDATLRACSGLACATMVEDVVRDISGSRLDRNARLPSERELAGKYGISVAAVRRGMEMLVDVGLVTRRQGSGTYVNGFSKKVAPSRADLILICRRVIHPASHPYYGYIYPALYTRLGELGWRVREYAPPSQNRDASQVDYQPIDPGRLAECLDSEPAVAGLVLHRESDETIAFVRQSGRPCMAIGATHGLPYVDYDWDAEFIQAIGLALRAGAQRVWAISSFPAGDDAHAIRAAKALVKGSGKTVIKIHRNPRSVVYSQVAYEACVATRAMLRGGKVPFDGIVIGSDFHAQGVLDALAEAGMTPDRCPVIVAMVNRESRIHSELPFTELVADGAAIGTVAAELLHERITNPAGAPDSQYLGCTLRLRTGFPRA